MNASRDELTQKVKSWLEKQGHSLEMRVAKAFREDGFEVSQFEHYVDSESKNVRQIDAVAMLSREIGSSKLSIKFYVECKYTKAFPWVILLTPQKPDKYAFFSRVLQGQNPTNWKTFETFQGRLIALLTLVLDKSKELEKFRIPSAGYTVLDATIKSDKDETRSKIKENAFTATVQISKSVEAHDIANEEFFQNYVETMKEMVFEPSQSAFTPGTGFLISFAIPIIVINGKLFESELSQENDIDVREVAEGVILVPYRQKEIDDNREVPLSPVFIVTEENLQTFIKRMYELAEILVYQESAVQELIEYEQSQIGIVPNDEGF